jgi:trk system potassium uptake protein TrkA
VRLGQAACEPAREPGRREQARGCRERVLQRAQPEGQPRERGANHDPPHGRGHGGRDAESDHAAERQAAEVDGLGEASGLAKDRFDGSVDVERQRRRGDGPIGERLELRRPPAGTCSQPVQEEERVHASASVGASIARGSSPRYAPFMNAIVIGCGRVGYNVALRLARAGWHVTAIDEKEEALGRLGENWTGGFLVGHGMDVDLLRQAGIEEADAVVVSTNGDNTNIVIAQVAQKRFDVQCVVVRILDPARAQLYADRGLRTVCPTSTAIDVLTETVRTWEGPDVATVPTVKAPPR